MKKSEATKKGKKSKDDKDYEKPVVAKTAYDLQRLKLMKLMKNPEKPILLPDRPKSKNSPSVPEFVRNVMGSSAGAGSGEFHVYRHLRRKEYSRQKFIQEKGCKETLDEEYHKKIEENRKQASQATAKKRAKRLKKKQKQKQAKRLKPMENSGKKEIPSNSNSESDASGNEEEPEKTVRNANENCTKIIADSEESPIVANEKMDETETSEKSIVASTSGEDIEESGDSKISTRPDEKKGAAEGETERQDAASCENEKVEEAEDPTKGSCQDRANIVTLKYR